MKNQQFKFPLGRTLKRLPTIPGFQKIGRYRSGRPTIATAPASAYERKVLRLAFLDPALQADILTGRQPQGFRLETFLRCEVPLAWPAQRAALGWPPKSCS